MYSDSDHNDIPNMDKQELISNIVAIQRMIEKQDRQGALYAIQQLLISIERLTD